MRKAGRDQVDSHCFIEQVFCSPASGRCRMLHPHSRGAIRFARCIWAFSFQPVLPSVWRLCSALEESNLGQAINAVTETRLGLCLFSTLFLERFGFYALWRTVVELLLCSGSYSSSAHPKVNATIRQLSRVATMARFFPLLPPRSASFRPQRLRSSPHRTTQNVLRLLAPEASQIGIGLLC